MAGKNKEYADKYAEYAMEQMRRYGIPASVTLAQGILESSNGQSELARKEKEAKKKQKVTVIKEIRCGITIEENDIAIKAKNARKFLLDGDKVKITIRFKGREAALSHLGVKILDNFVSKLEDVCVVEKPAKQDGRNMTMVLAPKKA